MRFKIEVESNEIHWSPRKNVGFTYMVYNKMLCPDVTANTEHKNQTHNSHSTKSTETLRPHELVKYMKS